MSRFVSVIQEEAIHVTYETIQRLRCMSTNKAHPFRATSLTAMRMRLSSGSSLPRTFARYVATMVLPPPSIDMAIDEPPPCRAAPSPVVSAPKTTCSPMAVLSVYPSLWATLISSLQGFTCHGVVLTFFRSARFLSKSLFPSRHQPLTNGLCKARLGHDSQ